MTERDSADIEQLAKAIQDIADGWKGANGGIYAIRGMSLELAKTIGPCLTPTAGEPVAWQWRYVGVAEWNTPSGGSKLTDEQIAACAPIEQRPLYATSSDAVEGDAQAARARKLDWQETFTDRGDGSKDLTGWEAETYFGTWYSVEQYFGSDSYAWHVKHDFDVIADCDDPDQAQEAAQADFEKRVRAALCGDVAQREQDPGKDAQINRLRYAILGYFEVFDRCGGSESVSPATFAAARQGLREALSISSTDRK